MLTLSTTTSRFESLGDEDAGTFLELDKPLTGPGFTSPDTALTGRLVTVTMFVFEFLHFSFSDLDGLQIVNEFWTSWLKTFLFKL
jgi:hypothetical protein